MQESGDIHIVDASNGTIAYEYVAKAKINSNWAVDKENQRLLLVGDVGKACLFDMTFMNFGVNKTYNIGIKNKQVSESESPNPPFPIPDSPPKLISNLS